VLHKVSFGPGVVAWCDTEEEAEELRALAIQESQLRMATLGGFFPHLCPGDWCAICAWAYRVQNESQP
jgi:hypothetical protein